MTVLPPNDPRRNNGGDNNGNDPVRAKEAPFDGRRRVRERGSAEEPGTMDVVGDLRDSPAVVALFLIGMAGWLLRERCSC